MVEEATLEAHLDPDDLDRLQNPTPHSSTPADDPNLLCSIVTFVDLMNSSQEAYGHMCENFQRRQPEVEMLSYDRVKRAIQDLSRLVTLEDNMCVNSCVTFTGPYANLDCCPVSECWEPRYDLEKFWESGGRICQDYTRYPLFFSGFSLFFPSPGRSFPPLYHYFPTTNTHSTKSLSLDLIFYLTNHATGGQIIIDRSPTQRP